MNNQKGFSLIELMITMAIMVFIIGLTGPAYNRILTGVKSSTSKDEVYHELVSSLELVRLDIEHVGLGIARDETMLPMSWNEASQTLTLHSVLNNTNQTTMGWALLGCSVASQAIIASTYIVNLKETANLQSMVLLDSDKNFGSLATPATFDCPAAIGVYSAYPYDNTATNGCNTGFCTRITYLPSALNGVPTSKAGCAQGTFDLVRRIGTAGVGGDSIINCVADFRVRFDVDNNSNGLIDVGESELSVLPATTATLMDNVKNVEFLLLVQTGPRVDTLNTTPNTTVSGVNLSLAAVTNANNYRWKVLKISGIPMSW